MNTYDKYNNAIIHYGGKSKVLLPVGPRQKMKNKYYTGGTDTDNKMFNDKKKALFPPINPQKFDLLRIDEPSLSYMTYWKHADEISEKILNNLQERDLNARNLCIVDMTACVGGNVLSFAKYFKNVIAIEYIKERAEYCANNVKLYGFNNVQVINGDSVKLINSSETPEKYHVFFMDPPWGGVDYKSKKKLHLTLGEVEIEDVCKSIFTKMTKMVLIVLKLPLNYDKEYLEGRLKKFKFQYIPFKKMMIVFLEKK